MQELLSSYSLHFTPSTPSSHHASASSFRIRDPSIVLERPRQNTMRIIFSYSYQCAIKSHFPQVPSASTMHCSSTLPQPQKSHSPQVHHASSMHSSSPLQQRHQKPLSVSAPCIPHALFFASAASSKPLSASALRIPHALFSASAASSKATFCKCTPHSVCLVLRALSTASSKHNLSHDKHIVLCASDRIHSSDSTTNSHCSSHRQHNYLPCEYSI